MQTIYFAGRCPWDAQAFVKMMLGLITTEAGRVSEAGENLEDAKCVKTTFDERRVTVTELMGYFFEITDPESVNRQGADTGEKYRTGVYSENPPPPARGGGLHPGDAQPQQDPRQGAAACPLHPECREAPRPPGQVPQRLLPHPQGAHD